MLNEDVWRLILAEVIYCPLLPSPCDSLIQSLKLLADDCELAAEYVESERARLRLQRVCTVWRNILDEFSHRFIIVTNNASPPPLGSRVQYPAGDCECRIPACPMAHPSPPTGRSKPIQAYIDISPTSERKIMDIITQHPTIRLLATAVDLDCGDAPFSLSALSQVCQSLTHLSFSELYIPPSRSGQILDLPELHTLTLNFYYPIQSISLEPGQRASHYSLRDWRLPKLQNLALKGGVWDSDSPLFGEVDALLIKVGKSLRGLLYNLWVFSPNQGDAPRPIPAELWTWCAGLHTIQTSLKILFAGPRPSRAHPGLTIVTVHLGNLDTLPQIGRLLWSPELFERFPEITQWPILRFCITTSWSTFYRKLRFIHETGAGGGDPCHWPKYFCKWVDLLDSKRYAIQDRYGVAIAGSDGLLPWLSLFREERVRGALE